MSHFVCFIITDENPGDKALAEEIASGALAP